MSDLFQIANIVCVLWGVVSMIFIASYISKYGVKINILLFRVLALKYLSQYHEISKRENGKSGPWFYSYIVSMNIALILAVIGMILK